MTSIREQILAWIAEELRLALPEYDVRRTRRRPVTVESRPSVSVNVVSEEATDSDLHGKTEVVASVEIVIDAVVDCESDLDPIVVSVFEVVVLDRSCNDLAEDIDYTGCDWQAEEAGDGLALSARLRFSITFTHSISDMATA
jgi:hypothetical protein